jgi:hypothetical protein
MWDYSANTGTNDAALRRLPVALSFRGHDTLIGFGYEGRYNDFRGRLKVKHGRVWLLMRAGNYGDF